MDAIHILCLVQLNKKKKKTLTFISFCIIMFFSRLLLSNRKTNVIVTLLSLLSLFLFLHTIFTFWAEENRPKEQQIYYPLRGTINKMLYQAIWQIFILYLLVSWRNVPTLCHCGCYCHVWRKNWASWHVLVLYWRNHASRTHRPQSYGKKFLLLLVQQFSQNLYGILSRTV